MFDQLSFNDCCLVKKLNYLPVPPRSGRLAMVITDVSGTAERIESLNGRVDLGRPADERDVDLRC